MNEIPRRILLIRTDRIGDVILTTPTASILKAQFPSSRISFLTREYTAPLLHHYPSIDEVLIYRPEGEHHGWKGHLRLSASLKAGNFDVAVLFFPTFSLAATLFLAGIPRRIGIRYRWYSPVLFNYPHSEHRKFGGKHELEFNVSLLGHIPGFIQPDHIEFEFQLKESLTRWLKEEIEENGLSGGYACIHPGSGGSAPNLSANQYRTILRFLLGNTDWKILFTGTETEKSDIDEIIGSNVNARIVNAGGCYSLEQLTGLISRSKLFISSSTGPLHIANAFGVPTLSFYCPATPTHPNRWGPFHQMEWAVVPEVRPCRRGLPAKCPLGNCLLRLSDSLIEDFLRRRLTSLQ